MLVAYSASVRGGNLCISSLLLRHTARFSCFFRPCLRKKSTHVRITAARLANAIQSMRGKQEGPGSCTGIWILKDLHIWKPDLLSSSGNLLFQLLCS